MVCDETEAVHGKFYGSTWPCYCVFLVRVTTEDREALEDTIQLSIYSVYFTGLF